MKPSKNAITAITIRICMIPGALYTNAPSTQPITSITAIRYKRDLMVVDLSDEYMLYRKNPASLFLNGKDLDLMMKCGTNTKGKSLLKRLMASLFSLFRKAGMFLKG